MPHAEVIVEVTDHTGRRDAHIVYARQVATGNNPEFSNEMARRLLRIRLDAHLERPRQRAEFRHPDLNTWVRANRARLTTRSSFERSEDIQSMSFCWVRATNRRETADFESPEPSVAGTFASGRHTAHGNSQLSLYNLGNLLADQGRFEEAEVLLRRSLAIVGVLNRGSEHEHVMGSLSNLGDVLRRASRHDDAERELTRAVELAEKLDFAGPFFSFAQLRIDQKRYDDAVDLLQRCLEIRRRKLDPGDDAIGEAVRKLAEVYRLMGREAEAVEVERQLPASDSVS